MPCNFTVACGPSSAKGGEISLPQPLRNRLGYDPGSLGQFKFLSLYRTFWREMPTLLMKSVVTIGTALKPYVATWAESARRARADSACCLTFHSLQMRWTKTFHNYV